MKRWIFWSGSHSTSASVGLLILRLGFGLSLAIAHGWGKLTSWSELSQKFPDPLGIGHQLSLAGALSGEVVGATLVAIGLCTRLAAIPAAFTMAIAFFMIHGADPFATKQKAFLYLIAFLTIMFTGPGRYSFDAKLGK